MKEEIFEKARQELIEWNGLFIHKRHGISLFIVAREEDELPRHVLHVAYINGKSNFAKYEFTTRINGELTTITEEDIELSKLENLRKILEEKARQKGDM